MQAYPTSNLQYANMEVDSNPGMPGFEANKEGNALEILCKVSGRQRADTWVDQP